MESHLELMKQIRKQESQAPDIGQFKFYVSFAISLLQNNAVSAIYIFGIPSKPLNL